MDCARADWSAVTSALPNATLAGVLAGFLLNGIVVFLIRGTDTFEQVRALSFMFAAFVALALDSYLFGLVSGDHTCQRAWTEAMLAAGLLGIGAVAIIAGFGLMVAAYIDTHKIRCGSKRVDGDEAQTSDGHRTFAPAIYLTLGYTILSVILACIVAGSTGGHWHPPDTLGNAAFIAIVVFVLLLSLVPLTCLLVGSVPSFKVEEEPSPTRQ